MKKTFILFSLLFLSIMLSGCSLLPTTTVTSDLGSYTQTSTSLSISVKDEDIYTSDYTVDDTITFSSSAVESLSNLVTITGSMVLIGNEGTVNYLTDSSSTYTASVIDSNDDVTINGEGTLIIQSNSHNGIGVDDDFVITSGNIEIDAYNNGITVNNDFTMTGGTLSIVSGNDGIQVENLDDDLLGNILISDGTFTISAYGDGMDASNVVAIYGGTFTISSGVGNSNITLVSGKGIKATKGINILGGTFTISSADDSLHANSDFYIQDGSLTLSSNDDGIHADDTLIISGGTIDITKSYEGIESAYVTITGGTIKIKSSDDGINCAGGADSSSNWTNFDQVENAMLTISGGYIYVNASGDGLDSNGNMQISGGTILVSGPTDSSNGAIDYNGTFSISGGTLIAVGASGMAENASSATNQASIMINLSTTSTSLIHLEDESGNMVIDFLPAKSYSSIVISSPSLSVGNTYKLYLGGSSSNLNSEGYANSGNYTYGTLNQSFTISSNITNIG
ncbi:MAG: carbohydrate-binding domain-containing protein, partial [Candidatus Izemoplasmatales bacterium]